MASDRANLVVSWKAVAIGAITVALSSLTGLAVVATVKNADTLSVVALAVAIVAFVIQILVFIVQAAASSQQELRAQELYGSTMSALSTIAEKAEGTRRDVSTISERMLSAILGKAMSETAISTSPESADFVEAVAGRVAQFAEEAAWPVEPDVMVPLYTGNQASSRFGLGMYIFPSPSEVQHILPKIEDLDGYELSILAILGRDLNQFDRGVVPFAGVTIDAPGRLIEKGLIQDRTSPTGFPGVSKGPDGRRYDCGSDLVAREYSS